MEDFKYITESYFTTKKRKDTNFIRKIQYQQIAVALFAILFSIFILSVIPLSNDVASYIAVTIYALIIVLSIAYGIIPAIKRLKYLTNN